MAYSLAKHLLGINFLRTLLRRLNLYCLDQLKRIRSTANILRLNVQLILQRFLELNFF